MLDEIINYVQSLQNQVEVIKQACTNDETRLKLQLLFQHFCLIQLSDYHLCLQFLSMRLASLNPMLYFGADLDDEVGQLRINFIFFNSQIKFN